jgi:hypothetical protein
VGFFVLGFLLPLLGIILAAVVKAPGQRLAQLTPAQGQGWWPDPTGRFEHRYTPDRQPLGGTCPPAEWQRGRGGPRTP